MHGNRGSKDGKKVNEGEGQKALLGVLSSLVPKKADQNWCVAFGEERNRNASSQGKYDIWAERRDALQVFDLGTKMWD